MNRFAAYNLLLKSISFNSTQCRFKIYPTYTKAEYITGKSAVGEWPKLADGSNMPPRMLEVEKGKTYAWCACGLSKKQPFCDGAHKQKNTELKPEEPKFGPLRFTAEDHKTVILCNCKKSSNRPFCDGTHETLVKTTGMKI